MTPSNWTIRTKLICGFAAVFAGFTVVAAVGYATLNDVKVKGPAYSNIVQSKDLIADVLPPPEYILESNLVLHELVRTRVPAEIDALLARFKQLRTDFDVRHDFWAKDLRDSLVKTTLLQDSYVPAQAFYKIATDELIPAVKSGDVKKANLLIDGTLRTAYEQHRAAIDKVVTLSTALNTKAEADAASLIAARSQLLLVAMALNGLIAIATILWLIRRITRPLRQITAVATAMSTGDFTQTVDVESTDEVGQLATAFRMMIQRFRDVVAKIGIHADELALASEHLGSASYELASGAASTASRIADAAVASQTVASNLGTVRVGAAQMADVVADIARSTDSVSRVTLTAVDATQRTNATVAELEQSSSAINDVVKLIAAIAQQTNLLALNATIEAARAGDAGKGFAVVAGEVKDLASETASATADIGRRVAAIQQRTAEVVLSMQQIESVIHEVCDSQQLIAAAYEEQTATAHEMSRGTADAQEGAVSISASIDEVSEHALKSADAAAESQKQAEELQALSTSLRALVNEFQLEAATSALV